MITTRKDHHLKSINLIINVKKTAKKHINLVNVDASVFCLSERKSVSVYYLINEFLLFVNANV